MRNLLIKLGYPLDEVVFYDTDMEFQAIYDARDSYLAILTQHDIKYTELKPNCEFCYTMFEKPVNVGKANEHNGYSWCGGRCRWGTTDKLKAIDNYCKGAVQYVGIAGDEWKRLVGIFEFDIQEYTDKKGNIKTRPILDKSNGCIQHATQISNFNKKYPLVELQMSEKNCLDYCYSKGFNWLEGNIDLYSILDRVSCWCCANKNLKELKNYYLYLPKYWEKLKALQMRTERPFKYNKYTIFDLEDKFKREVSDVKD